MTPFFVLAFAITWSLQGLVIAEALPATFDLPLLAVAGIGPSIAALLVGCGRVSSSLRLPLRGAWPAAAAALVIPPLVRWIAGRLAPGAVVPPAIGLVALGSVIVPPLGEELGWRGLALPRLAERIGFRKAAVLVAALWALWHLPTAFFPGARLFDFPLFALAVTAGGVFVAWVQRRGGGNVLLAVAAHAAMNGAAIFIAVPDGAAARWIAAVLWIGVAAGCLIAPGDGVKALHAEESASGS